MLYICKRNQTNGNRNKRKEHKMSNKIRFTKMQGAGNDYIYVNTLAYPIPNPSLASQIWSKYHFKIGSDGLVLIGRPSDPAKADYSMHIYNADGSEAMMCGNASRCIGKYLYEKGLTFQEEIRLETLSGVKILKLHLIDNKETGKTEVESVTVDMLEPQLEEKAQYNAEVGKNIQIEDRIFNGTFVSMGNPHYVIFVNDIDTIDIARYGSKLEVHPAFPQRCNIEFAEVRANGEIRTRVWERGSGITLACGTGACATAVAAALTGRAERKSKIVMDGGTLEIEWKANNNHIYMTGPAAFAFEGEIELPE